MNPLLKAAANPLRTRSSLLLVTLTEGDDELTGTAAAADTLLGGAIARAIADGEVGGKRGRSSVFHVSGKAGPTRIAVVGVGKGEDREKAREKFAELRKEADASVLEALTSEQKDNYEKLKGPKFEMPQGAGFGGPGGFGNGGFGKGKRPEKKAE